MANTASDKKDYSWVESVTSLLGKCLFCQSGQAEPSAQLSSI
jgi:hypothetical protein